MSPMTIICQHADRVHNYLHENPAHCVDLTIEGKIVGHVCGLMAAPHKPRAIRNGTILRNAAIRAANLFARNASWRLCRIGARRNGDEAATVGKNAFGASTLQASSFGTHRPVFPADRTQKSVATICTHRYSTATPAAAAGY